METNTNELYNLSEVQLVYKTKFKPSERPKITSSQDAYRIFKQLWNEDTVELFEESKLLMLNRTNKVIGVYNLSSGGTDSVLMDPKLIFVTALKCIASGIIICHNHPSQNTQPSQPDRDMTKRLKEAGKLIGIPLLDHIIYTPTGYFSFADEGLL